MAFRYVSGDEDKKSKQKLTGDKLEEIYLRWNTICGDCCSFSETVPAATVCSCFVDTDSSFT
jgi:hypothetical protein